MENQGQSKAVQREKAETRRIREVEGSKRGRERGRKQRGKEKAKEEMTP